MNILIVAGGTGGHISPGVALAQAVREQGAHVEFLSLEKNRKYPDLAAADFPVHFYSAPSLSRSPVELALFGFRFAAAVRKAWALMKNRQIQKVVGMGGFPMAPAILAARLLKIPYYLCEQNAVPGRATAFFARKSRRIYITFPVSKGALPDSKMQPAGNPLRDNIGKYIKENKLNNGQKILKGGMLRILILGGSQGARQINLMALDAAMKIPDAQWIIQCGQANLAEMEKVLEQKKTEARSTPEIRLIGFHTAMHELYGDADILVCRSGAGVLTEAACFGIPMILIPYPFASDNHQMANALVFEKSGAAAIIDTREFTPGRLIGEIEKLRSDAEKRRSMGEAALKLARPFAGREIAHSILSDET